MSKHIVKPKTSTTKLPSIQHTARKTHPPTATPITKLGSKHVIPHVSTRARTTIDSTSQPMSVSGDQIQSPVPVQLSHESRQAKLAPPTQETKRLGGKMSLVCQLKLITLRREANLLKQTLPLTDDLVEVLKDKSIIDSHLFHKLKKADITSRWDPVLDFAQENTQISIFGIWDYLIQRKDTLLPGRLQETFNCLVNQHFDKDLQPLQLNKDRQNKVARVMLDNMRKADGYVDELNASIRQYQMYTKKMANLVKPLNADGTSSGGSDQLEEPSSPSITGQDTTMLLAHVPESIHVIYDKVKTYVNQLEDTTEDQRDEMERLQIKLYEAHGEIETMEDKANKLRMEIKAKQQQIKNLQEDRETLGKELNQTKQELDEAKNQKEHFNKKLDEMMNAMVCGMNALKQDVTLQLKKEVGLISETVDRKVDTMEERMNARMDQVQDTINDIQNAQEGLRDDMSRVEDKVGNMQKHKKEKNMNLKISIRGPEVHDDQLIKTRSDKLRSVQGK